MPKKTFLIIDGHAILHRAFHALPPLTAKGGQPINAVYGFFSILLSVVKETDPTWVAVCLDTPKPTFRHQEFVGYQAKRPPTDPRLAVQIDTLKEILKSTKMAHFVKPGFEADDLIATLCFYMKKRPKTKVYVLTGDKDLMQLVDKQVNLLIPQKGMSRPAIIDEKEVKKRLGVKASQVVDYKALAGDSSDNYPGVLGIGPKTAVELLSRYKTLANIYRHCGDISENVRKKLAANKEASLLSRRLAQVYYQAPIKLNLEKAVFDKGKLILLSRLFEKHRFPSLLKRLEKDFDVEPKTKQIKLI